MLSQSPGTPAVHFFQILWLPSDNRQCAARSSTSISCSQAFSVQGINYYRIQTQYVYVLGICRSNSYRYYIYEQGHNTNPQTPFQLLWCIQQQAWNRAFRLNIGIVFVLLGKRILGGKPGVSGRGNEPQVQSPSCKERNKAIIYISTHPNKWVTTRTCIIRKPRMDTGYHTKRNLTHGVDCRTQTCAWNHNGFPIYASYGTRT